MSKTKNKNATNVSNQTVDTSVELNESATNENIEAVVENDKKAVKEEATTTAKKDKKQKSKKDKKPSKVAKKTKEVFSELKKVTWPKFSTVVKQTGVVIAVVIFFTVVLFGFDRLLSLLINLLV